MVNGKGGDGDVSIFGWLSLEGWLFPLSLLVRPLLTSERSLGLKTAALFGVAQFTESGRARYRSQQKHSTHRPANQWGAAGLPD